MKLSSIFVGRPKEVSYNGRPVTTGIFKDPVTGPVQVGTLNLEGDRQADLTVHGGVDKAVYAYPSQHYAFWKTTRPDLDFAPGVFGENLSVEGLDETTVCIGDVYAIGSAVFRVTSPRMPCFKLGIKMEDPGFVKDFMQAHRTGFYFRVLEEGTIEAGNAIAKVEEDGYGLTVEEVTKLYTVEKKNEDLLRRAIHAPNLPEDWSGFFQQRLARLVD